MPLINRSSLTFKITSFSIIGIICVIIIKIFLDNWHLIPFGELSFNISLLIIASLFSIVNPVISAGLWKYILHLIGEKPSFIGTWRINTYSQIARYIPGKVWQYMGKLYWGKKIGLSEKKIVLSVLLETIFLLGGSFIVSLFSIHIFIQNGYIPSHYLVLVCIVVLMTLVFLHPRILEKVINTFGKKWLSQPVQLNFSFYHILLLIFLYSFQWFIIGLQFFLFIRSFYAIQIEHFVYFTSINAAGWLIGFLSLIAPSGLIIKETVFVFGFKFLVPVAFAIVCAVLLRLFTLITEIIITAIFFILDKGAWKNLIEFRKSSPEVRTVNND